MRLILIRHGETQHNRGGLTLGRYDVPLNARGRAQAQAVASSFSRPPDAIYTSPLVRATETASIIGGATGVDVNQAPGLIEMDVGAMEHLSREELRLRYPSFLTSWLSPEAGMVRMPGGENLQEVQERAWAAVERMQHAHPHGRVVAVTHNFVILTLICRAIGLPLNSFRRLRQGLASRTIMDMQDGHATLLQMNDNSHLLAAGLGDDVAESEAVR